MGIGSYGGIIYGSEDLEDSALGDLLGSQGVYEMCS